MRNEARVQEVNAPDRPSRLLAWILRLFWRVHPTAVLMVRATPTACLKTLATAAKPSTTRLHHRNLFADGRRYDLSARRGGFRLMTTSKVLWNYRRRTTAAAILLGSLHEMEDGLTRVTMTGRISYVQLLWTVGPPLFMTSMLIYVPWPPILIILVLTTIFGLSWIGNRYNAVLEATEMVFFVQKALEDLDMAEVMALNAPPPDDVTYTDHDFSQAWETFYEQHKDQ